MKNVEKIAFVIGIMFITNTFTTAQIPDPKEILQKAVSAIQNIKSVTYQVEEYSIGTVKVGDTDAILTPHQGKVLFVRSTEDEFFGGKVVIEGELVRTTSERTNSNFKVVYDGKKIRKIDYKRKVVYVNDPDQKGMGLLIGAAELVLKEYRPRHPELRIRPHPLSRLLCGTPPDVLLPQPVVSVPLATPRGWRNGASR